MVFTWLIPKKHWMACVFPQKTDYLRKPENDGVRPVVFLGVEPPTSTWTLAFIGTVPYGRSKSEICANYFDHSFAAWATSRPWSLQLLTTSAHCWDGHSCWHHKRMQQNCRWRCPKKPQNCKDLEVPKRLVTCNKENTHAHRSHMEHHRARKMPGISQHAFYKVGITDESSTNTYHSQHGLRSSLELVQNGNSNVKLKQS